MEGVYGADSPPDFAEKPGFTGQFAILVEKLWITP